LGEAVVEGFTGLNEMTVANSPETYCVLVLAASEAFKTLDEVYSC
jgi:hypothetical protein